MKRRLLLLLIFLLSAYITVSCQPQIDLTENNNANPQSSFKVAIILPELIDEGSWSPAGYQGIKLIEEKLNAEVAYTENINHKTVAEVTDIFRNYAQQNFDFIIGHGTGNLTIPAAETVAKEFPRISFALTEVCPGNNANLGCLDFFRGEISYLVGVAAALKTQTQKITYFGGYDYPTLEEEAIAIIKGAKYINPNIQVNIIWLQDWTDTDKALKMAQKEIDLGVDVLILHGDPATTPVHQLAESHNIWTIAWNMDQHSLAPKAIITSAIFKIPELLLKAAILVQEGRWEGQQYKFGFLEGVQELAPFRGSLNPEAEAKFNEIKQEILRGNINVLP